MAENKQTYDTPWKEIIEFFFPQFMEFFVPGSTEDIDWDVKIKFLDKEFQKITKESATGRRHTDKLVEVTLKNRSKKWILIHIEVQSQKKPDFSAHRSISYGKTGLSKAIIDKQESIVYVHSLNPG